MESVLTKRYSPCACLWLQRQRRRVYHAYLLMYWFPLDLHLQIIKIFLDLSRLVFYPLSSDSSDNRDSVPEIFHGKGTRFARFPGKLRILVLCFTIAVLIVDADIYCCKWRP